MAIVIVILMPLHRPARPDRGAPPEKAAEIAEGRYHPGPLSEEALALLPPDRLLEIIEGALSRGGSIVLCD